MSQTFNPRPIHVPPEVLILPISGAARLALIALLRFVNKSMRCWPGLAALLMYLPPTFDRRHLRRALHELEKHPLGILRVEPRMDEETGGYVSNIYAISIPSFKKIRAFYDGEKSAPPCANFTPSPAPKLPPGMGVYIGLNSFKELKEKERVVNNPVDNRLSPFSASGQNSKSLKTIPEREILVQAWRDAYKAKIGQNCPITGPLKIILGNLWQSENDLDTCRLAIRLFFEKSYRHEFSTFNFKWAEKARESGYAPEAFERCIHQIVSSTPFRKLKKEREAAALAV